MPRASLAPERRLHLGVGPQGRAATLDNAFAGRETFTLSAEAAAESIAKIWGMVREWRVFFEEYGVPRQMEKIAPAFRHIDDVATPLCGSSFLERGNTEPAANQTSAIPRASFCADRRFGWWRCRHGRW